MDIAGSRVRIFELSSAGVCACSAGAPDAPPFVSCARWKAQAIDAELCSLVSNEEAALVQLEAIRDAAIAAGRPETEVFHLFEARTAEVRTAAASKRVALQTEAVAVDVALEGVISAVAARTEVRFSFPPATLRRPNGAYPAFLSPGCRVPRRRYARRPSACPPGPRGRRPLRFCRRARLPRPECLPPS